MDHPEKMHWLSDTIHVKQDDIILSYLLVDGDFSHSQSFSKLGT